MIVVCSLSRCHFHVDTQYTNTHHILGAQGHHRLRLCREAQGGDRDDATALSALAGTVHTLYTMYYTLY
jgi:hypothetical protein